MSPSRPTVADSSAVSRQRSAHAAHEALGQGAGVDGRLRRIVQDSWRRSLALLPDPSRATARIFCSDDELEAYRRSHPLAGVMPVITRLLVQPSFTAGMLVAVGDQRGRLLWVDGDRQLRRRAEGMLFMAGTDWSEGIVGTSAPGTALALGRSVQIAGAEHYNPSVHPWSCTAVPVHDPDSGSVLGVVDVTGAEEAAADHTLALVQAAVAAAEAHLSINRLRASAPPRRTRLGARARAISPVAPTRPLLRILGVDHGTLELGGTRLELSLRHTELLTLLALHPEGLTAEELSVMAYAENASVTTVRAEMLRLRRALAGTADAVVPSSRPYRLPTDLSVDALQVLDLLRRGEHRSALRAYAGPVLPRSESSAIRRLGSETAALLRGAVLDDGAPDTLLAYLALPEAEDDVGAWHLALQSLPERSPRRPGVVAHLALLEADLAAPPSPHVSRNFVSRLQQNGRGTPTGRLTLSQVADDHCEHSGGRRT